ncbi:MAG: tRNA pseudouridine(55) synthase TruB [Dehalococcoidales bacterium]|nr:tRNA pseudouridine(55) synthase TruB [Dehalococcoidales bacterium]
MNGILNVDKPSGVTSFQIVALVRRLSGERRVGHAGTLDPMATGVLPICLGQATRVVEFFGVMTKRYIAEIELGIETDTYDISGQVTRRIDPTAINRKRLEEVLIAFRGPIQQTPPMYSAVKYCGKPLYTLARAGIEVERKPRIAEIHSLELVDFHPPVATLDIVCGKGTYIRAIAHDMGQVLGCGAAMRSLVRTRYGRFDKSESVSVEKLTDAFRLGNWKDLMHPPDCVLTHLPAVVLDNEAEKHMKMGRTLTPAEVAETTPVPEAGEATVTAEQCRAYALDGRFVGVLRFNAGNGFWHPEKVLLNL